jgi:hypothetical protein
MNNLYTTKMTKRVSVILTDEDAAKLEQAFKDGKLKELGIESIEFPSAQNRQWANSEVEQRGNAKDGKTPKFP